MRRTLIIAVALSVVLGGAIWAGATVRARSGAAERVVSPSPGLVRASRSWGVGPAASYDFDNGNIFTVTPIQVSLAAGSAYDVVVSVSLDYRSSPDDRFVVGLVVRDDAQYGPLMTVKPAQRAVSASRAWTSTTALFRLTGLEGGHVYWFSPGVNVSHRDSKASIESRNVAIVIDATPAM
jgi:hypothetical protein